MKPEIWIVVINATSNYSQQMVEKYGRIYDVFWFNKNEVTNCCEFTPSYYLNYVTSYCEKVPDDEELREALPFTDGGYYHCHYIDNLSSCKLIDDFSTHDTEDYEDDLDNFVREWVRPHEYV